MDITERINLITENKSEEEVVSILHKDCKPILDIIKKSGTEIYRGYKNSSISDIKKISSRSDRQPRIICKTLHDMLDKKLKKKFGWNVRSEGVFTSTDIHSAAAYGHSYLFFPIGPFKYVYIQCINDLYDLLGDFNADLCHKQPKGRIEKDINRDYDVDDIINGYKNTGLDSNLRNRPQEIVFKCKSYYLVDEIFGEAIFGSLYYTL